MTEQVNIHHTETHPIVGWSDLKPQEKLYFDYITEDLETGEETGNHEFVRYAGNVYDLGEFREFSMMDYKWKLAFNETWFSGLVAMKHPETNTVTIAMYYT